VDLVNAAAGLLGLPPLNGSIDFALGSLDYTTLSVYAGMDMSFVQDFTFAPRLFGWVNVAETGQNIPLNLSGATSITFPEGESKLTLTPTYQFTGALTNRSSLCFGAEVGAGALALSAEVFGEGIFNLGPLFSTNQQWDCVGGRANLHTADFALGGYAGFSGPSFTVEAVPEPYQLFLAGSGLITICLIARRRRHN
jgi:hypothetical protein